MKWIRTRSWHTLTLADGTVLTNEWTMFADDTAADLAVVKAAGAGVQVQVSLTDPDEGVVEPVPDVFARVSDVENPASPFRQALDPVLSATYASVISPGVASGTNDTAAIQAALDAAAALTYGAVVRGNPGQNYKISAPLVVHAGTTVDMTGVTVTLLTGSNCNMVQSAGVTSGTRDANIKIIGGTWVRGSNGGSGSDQHTMRFRKVDGLLVSGVTITSTGGKYGISLGDLTDYVVRDASFNVASDGVHICGPASNGLVSGIFGVTVDDAVAVTPRDWSGYDDTGGGDVTDLVIENVFADSSLSVVKVLAGNTGNAKRVTLRGIYGTATGASSGVIWLGNDAGQVNTTGGYIDRITLEDIHVSGPNGAPLVLANGTDMRRVTVRGLTVDNAAATAPVINVAHHAAAVSGMRLLVRDVRVVAKGSLPVVSTNTSASLASLVLDGITVDSVTGGTVLASVNCPVTSLVAQNISAPTLTAGTTLFNIAATVGTMSLRGVHMVSTSGSTQMVTVAAGTVTDLFVSDFAFKVTSGYLLTLNNAASVVTRARLHAGVMVGGSGVVSAITSTHVLGVVELDGVTNSGTSWIADLATNTDLLLRGHMNPSFGNGAFNLRATGVLRVRGAGNSIGGNVVTAAGYAFRVNDPSFSVDLSKITSRSAGDMALNTNAGLSCGAGLVVSDGTNWKNLYSGAIY